VTLYQPCGTLESGYNVAIFTCSGLTEEEEAKRAREFYNLREVRPVNYLPQLEDDEDDHQICNYI